MRSATPSLSLGLLVATAIACGGPPPPPPLLTITSPQRGLMQGDATQLTVTGTVQPATLGTSIRQVTVNGVAASLQADGSFTAQLAAPHGAMLLQTVATADDGGAATDVRAVQTGQLHPVGTQIDRAVSVALSADTFAKLAAIAGPRIKALDLTSLLAPYNPLVSSGDSIANVKLSVTSLKLGDARISLTPSDGGLAFSAEVDALQVAANAAYGGALVPDGSSPINVTADRITVGGMLQLTPAGAAGFTAQLTSPTIRTTALTLKSTGLAGSILDLLDGTLESSIESIVTKTAELELAPLINDALGALAGPQDLDIAGVKLHFQASPSAIHFSKAGALVTVALQATIAGAETSPGFIATDHVTPTLDAGAGVQLGLAEDLINGLLAQAHAIHLLDIALDQDLGPVNGARFQLTLPPMVNTNNPDGTLRLVLGDIIATFAKDGNSVARAAINAQIDVKLAPTGSTTTSLQFGAADLRINLLDTSDDTITEDDLMAAASKGISLQLDSLSKLLITLPIPSLEGVQLENVSVGGARGYIVVSGRIH